MIREKSITYVRSIVERRGRHRVFCSRRGPIGVPTHLPPQSIETDLLGREALEPRHLPGRVVVGWFRFLAPPAPLRTEPAIPPIQIDRFAQCFVFVIDTKVNAAAGAVALAVIYRPGLEVELIAARWAELRSKDSGQIHASPLSLVVHALAGFGRRFDLR
jgi:hypothetical protein